MKSLETMKLKRIARDYAGGTERPRGRGRRKSDVPPPLVLNGKPLSAFAKGKAEAADDEGGEPARVERVLTMKAIDSLSINDAELALHEMRREPPDDGVTHKDDVIISLTAPFQTACIDEQHEGIFITNAFAVIRCSAGRLGPAAQNFPLDPWFLAAYLSRDSVRESLRGEAAGKRWPSLRLKQIEDIEIPILSLAEQNELGNLARAMANHAAERRRQEAAEAEQLERAFSAALGKPSAES